MVAGYLRSALAAALQWIAPLREARKPLPAPAEIAPATIEMLNRLRLPQLRAALVLSLWEAHPARQCAIGARYEFASPELTIPAAAIAGEGAASGAEAHALQQRLAMRFPVAAQPAAAAVSMPAAAEAARAAA